MPRSLIGRRAELERIRALLATDRGPAGLVVLGDAGIGKSRLLAEALDGLRLPTYRVVGYETEQQVPLASASGLLRSLVAAPTHGRALDVLAFGGDTHSAVTTSPASVFEAAHRALAELGQSMLVVDDVQWVDPLSLALVHYLARAADATDDRLLILAAGRNVATALAFADDLTRLLAGRSGVLQLGPVAPEDARRLASSIDPGLSDDDLDAVCRRSEGVPFWIELLTRSAGAPVDIGTLLRSRLGDPPPDALSVLATLAVLARPSTVHELAQVLGWPAQRVDTALVELVASGVATRTAVGVRFAHDLWREAVAGELRPAQRRQLHRRIAAWLEATATGDLPQLREALGHRLASGELPTALAATLVSSPQRRLLGAEGLAMLRRLSAVAEGPDGGHRPDADTAEAHELASGIAALASELDEQRLALELWRSYAPAARPERRSDAYLAASKAAFELGWQQTVLAHELLREAVAAAASEHQVVAARAHEARIRLWLDHDTPGGAALAREAAHRARAIEPGHRARFDALVVAHEAAMQESDGEEMLRLAELMLVEVRGQGPEVQIKAFNLHGSALGKTRPLEEAERSHRAAWQLATDQVLPNQIVASARSVAGVLFDQGRLVEAEQVLTDISPLAARVNDGVVPTWPLARQIAVMRGAGDRAFAALACDVERRSDPHVRIVPRHVRAQLLSRVYGERAAEEVLRELDRARRDADDAACPRCSLELRVVAADALTRIGRVEAASRELAAIDTGELRDALGRVMHLHADALVTSATDPRSGSERLQAASEEWSRLGWRVERLWTQVDLARVLHSIDGPRAVRLLREVAATADEIGSVAQREVAEQELRRLGVHTWARSAGRTDAASLSEREREVANLLRQGASNPEIARALFLSRKTVERHVSNVLAKLGAQNRAQVAAMLSSGVGRLAEGEGEGVPR